MRDAVDVLFALVALVVAAGFVRRDITRRQLAVVAVLAVAAFAAFRVARTVRSAPALPAGQAPLACAGALQADPAAAVGALDDVRAAGAPAALRDGARVARGTELVFTGWLAGFSGTSPADSACLAIDGTVDDRAAGSYGGARPDVAQALGQPSLSASGFTIRYATAQLAPGTHRFAVVAVGGARTRAIAKTVAVDVVP